MCRMIQVPAPLPGRPFYVSVEGGRLYVSVQDAFYLQRQGEFKRRIRLVHPDRNHHSWACARTRNLLKARERWEAQEARWYGRLGLDPPTRPPRCKPSCGSRSSAAPRALPASAERPEPSCLTFGKAHASPATACNEHHDFTDVTRTGPEQRFKPSLTPTCHSPPGAWRATDRVDPLLIRTRSACGVTSRWSVSSDARSSSEGAPPRGVRWSARVLKAR
jgi:hypothetical protein